MESFFSLLTQIILPQIGKFLFWGIWIVVPVLLFLSFQSRRKLNWVTEQKYILLAIHVPKENERGPIAAEMMFASLHGIFKPEKTKFLEGSLQEHISFEIASVGNQIKFFVWMPEHLKDFIEGQIYAQYPNVEIEKVHDYTNISLETKNQIMGTEFSLTKQEFFPIKTFPDFEVDPLSGITGVLGKLEEKEQVWIQMLVKPTGEQFQKNGLDYIDAVRAGTSPLSFSGASLLQALGKGINMLLSALSQGGEQSAAAEPPKLSSAQEAQLEAIEQKVSKLGFEVKIKISYVYQNTTKVKPILQSVIGSFKQFSAANFNSFQGGKILSGKNFLQDYQSRLFEEKGFVLNTEELASIFHLPTITVETPTISWTKSKKGEPPDNLPTENIVDAKELASFAETNFRHIKQKFGIKNDDRRRHMYLIGKTGMGKTNMLKNMALADIRAGKGVTVVDPHGDLIDEILDFIPPERINDAIVFDPSDREYPIAFNPLEAVNPDYKGLVASGMISIFQKIWAFTWGPRLEHILRNTLLALLEYPNSTLLSVNRMLTDNKFRKKVVKKVTDVEVKRFWTQEFPGYQSNPRLVTEAISPIQNKVGQFLSSSTIRNIIGQPKSTIDMREVMDTGKILLIKLAQGTIGEDNSALLGAMMISKIQLAAMSRVDILEKKRRDFYLYVDEFQNFATESFAKILSEARKYGLNLIVANQYIAQMPEVVRDAVFGNIGTIVCFRIGAMDATLLAKEMMPVFDETDIVNLDKYNIYLKLSIDGVTSPAFSAKTLPPVQGENENKEKIIHLSRERYSTDKKTVEEKIARWMEIEETEEEPNRQKSTFQQPKYPPKEKERIEKVRVERYPEKRITPTEILEDIIQKPKQTKPDETKKEENIDEKNKIAQDQFKKTQDVPKEEIKPQESIQENSQEAKEEKKPKTYDLKEGEEVKIKNNH